MKQNPAPGGLRPLRSANPPCAKNFETKQPFVVNNSSQWTTFLHSEPSAGFDPTNSGSAPYFRNDAFDPSATEAHMESSVLN